MRLRTLLHLWRDPAALMLILQRIATLVDADLRYVGLNSEDRKFARGVLTREGYFDPGKA